MENHFYRLQKHLIKILILLLFSLFSTIQIKATMRVHPFTSNKRNITSRDGEDSFMTGNANKKLRRLPHVFSKVLELPFLSDTDVVIEDSPEFIRFVAEIDIDGDDIRRDVKALAVEIHPGVTKIVLRNGCCDPNLELRLDKLHVDTWRYRLPALTRPELATAVLIDGELTVTVPKVEGGIVQGREIWRGDGRFVLVQ